MLTFVLLLPFIYNLALQSVTGLKGPSSSGRDVARKDSEEDYPEEEEEFSADQFVERTLKHALSPHPSPSLNNMQS